MFEMQLTDDERRRFHNSIANGLVAASVVTFMVLRYVVRSPWGKRVSGDTYRKYLGPLINAKLSWFLFEVQNLLWCCLCFINRDRTIFGYANMTLLSMFVGHYINRALIYPFRMSRKSKPMPLAVTAAAFVFCSFNG